jgi:hypothetical protein
MSPIAPTFRRLLPCIGNPTSVRADDDALAGAPKAAVWGVSAVAAFLHLSVLSLAATHIANPAVFYAVLVVPVAVAALLHPADTLRRSYRWLAVFLVALTSTVSVPALLVGEVWLIRRTWIENAGRPARLLCGQRPHCPGTQQVRHTRPVHD